MSKRRKPHPRMPKHQPKLPASVPQVLDQGGPSVPPGTVVHWMVAHAASCALLNRRGPCNCDPDVRPIGDSGPYGTGRGRI